MLACVILSLPLKSICAVSVKCSHNYAVIICLHIKSRPKLIGLFVRARLMRRIVIDDNLADTNCEYEP